MSRFVRSSKYRHVYGKAAKPELCFIGIRLTKNAWDQNFIAVNPQLMAVCWATGGGGAVGIIPHSDAGRLGEVPLIAGHKGSVLGLDWNPFNDNLLATVSEDAKIKIWNVPDTGLEKNLGPDDAVQTLVGHKRKIGSVAFNPVADNIIATSSTDLSIRTWDIEKGAQKSAIEAAATSTIQSVGWNFNGSLLCAHSKDKKLRIHDPRQAKIAEETDGHSGVKGARVTWLGRKELIFSVGFSRSSQRQYCLWDPKSLAKPLVGPTNLDSSSGVIMPFFDPDTNCVFLAGKGDGNVRYFEITDDGNRIYSLSEFKTNKPTRGMGALPKRGIDVNKNEIMRLYKVHENQIEPISFMVPRKSDLFQDDIFPDCAADEPALSAEEWWGGKNAEPKTKSLAPGFVDTPKPKKEFKPTKQEVDDGPQGEAELREAYEKLKKRVAYLEAELIKKDAKIKELGGN